MPCRACVASCGGCTGARRRGPRRRAGGGRSWEGGLRPSTAARGGRDTRASLPRTEVHGSQGKAAPRADGMVESGSLPPPPPPSPPPSPRPSSGWDRPSREAFGGRSFSHSGVGGGEALCSREGAIHPVVRGWAFPGAGTEVTAAKGSGRRADGWMPSREGCGSHFFSPRSGLSLGCRGLPARGSARPRETSSGTRVGAAGRRAPPPPPPPPSSPGKRTAARAGGKKPAPPAWGFPLADGWIAPSREAFGGRLHFFSPRSGLFPWVLLPWASARCARTPRETSSGTRMESRAAAH